MNDSNQSLKEQDIQSDELHTESVVSAGALLREARQSQGMDIAYLASTLKISAHKLEALEDDRYDLLPDVVFIRSLAIAVCRRLGIDDEPVLKVLPKVKSVAAEQTSVDLSMRSRPTVVVNSTFGRKRRSRLWWLLGLLLIVLAVLYFMPPRWYEPLLSGMNTAQNSNNTSAGTDIPVPIPGQTSSSPHGNRQDSHANSGMAFVPVQVSTSNDNSSTDVVATNAVESSEQLQDVQEGDAPAQEGASDRTDTTENLAQASDNNTQVAVSEGQTQAAVVNNSTGIHFVATANSWIAVKTSTGATIYARTLPAGESLTLPLENLPLTVRVGNALATTVTVRGNSFNLRPHTQGNVATFEVR